MKRESKDYKEKYLGKLREVIIIINVKRKSLYYIVNLKMQENIICMK